MVWGREPAQEKTLVVDCWGAGVLPAWRQKTGKAGSVRGCLENSVGEERAPGLCGGVSTLE